MSDDSIDDLIAEQLSAGDQSERLGGLTDEELRILQGALERMRAGQSRSVQFAPEGQIRAEELDESGEPTGNSRDYDMATGQESRTIRSNQYQEPVALREMKLSRMRMDGAGAGPMPVQKYEEKLLPSIKRIVREPMLKKLPKPALPKKTMDYTIEPRSPMFEKELGLSYRDAAQMPVLPKSNERPQKKKAEESDDE